MFFFINRILGEFLKFIWTRFNISRANCFVKLKLDQDVALGILSITTKFQSYNCWGCLRNSQFRIPFSFGNDANGFVNSKLISELVVAP